MKTAGAQLPSVLPIVAAGSKDTLNEHQHQVRIFLLLDRISTEQPERAGEMLDIWASPNGGHRKPGVAGYMKAEGVRKGVLDITVMCPKRGFHALVVELKTSTGRLTTEQRERIERLRARGYDAQCLRGWIPTAKYICDYLGIAWQPRWEVLVEWEMTQGRKARRRRGRGLRRKVA